MTEKSYQEARKVMQKANYMRGLITIAKGNVAKWMAIEDSYRQNLRQGQAEGAKKIVDKYLNILSVKRADFAALVFPDNNLADKPNRCPDCGAKVAPNENHICDEFKPP